MTDWLESVLIDDDIGLEVLIPMLDLHSRVALSSVCVSARGALSKTYNKHRTMLHNFGRNGVCEAAAEYGDVDVVTRCVIDLGCPITYPTLAMVILPGCMKLVLHLFNLEQRKKSAL
jgi:hypothetical protein